MHIEHIHHMFSFGNVDRIFSIAAFFLNATRFRLNILFGYLTKAFITSLFAEVLKRIDLLCVRQSHISQIFLLYDCQIKKIYKTFLLPIFQCILSTILIYRTPYIIIFLSLIIENINVILFTHIPNIILYPIILKFHFITQLFFTFLENIM